MRGLGSFGMLTDFWKITKEMNPKAIEEEAIQNFRIIITGYSIVDVKWMHDALSEGRPQSVALVSRPLAPEGPSVEELPEGDIYIYVARPAVRLSREEADAVHRLDARGYPVILILTPADDRVSDEEAKLGADLILGTIPPHRIVVVQGRSWRDIDEKALPAVLETVPHLQLGLARQLPRFRTFVSQQIIRETSRVNAEFALLSSIPASIPIIGPLVATGADLMVLTKNQVMMLFKLAAIHDRNLAAKMPLALEIAPVIGGAFLWRSLARTLVDLLPGFVSVVPKTLIAAVGTYVVGSIALFYYETGHKPDGSTVDQFKRDGVARVVEFFPEVQKRIAGLMR